jgi:hypothetical protein
MRSLLDDWVDVFERNAALDKSHFLALFKEHNSKEELNKILRYFPRQLELIQVVETVFNAGDFESGLYLLPKNRAETDTLLIQAAQAWLGELAAYFEFRNVEFYGICMNAEVSIIGRDELNMYRGKDMPTYWIFEELSDNVFNSVILEGDRIYYLQEALYGIAADYYLSYYMMHPLVNLPINFQKYFDFWGAGGIGYLTKDQFLISSTIG